MLLKLTSVTWLTFIIACNIFRVAYAQGNIESVRTVGKFYDQLIAFDGSLNAASEQVNSTAIRKELMNVAHRATEATSAMLAVELWGVLSENGDIAIATDKVAPMVLIVLDGIVEKKPHISGGGSSPAIKHGLEKFHMAMSGFMVAVIVRSGLLREHILEDLKGRIDAAFIRAINAYDQASQNGLRATVNPL